MIFAGAWFILRDIACRPRRKHLGGIGGIQAVGEQMVRAVERDETLRMLRRREYGRGMLNANGLISRRVHDEQRLAQIGNVARDRLALGVLYQAPADREGASAKRDIGDAVSF